MVVERCNRRFGSETIHPTQKFTLMNYLLMSCVITYSEVPNRRADQNKRAGLEESDTLLAYLLSKRYVRLNIFCNIRADLINKRHGSRTLEQTIWL